MTETRLQSNGHLLALMGPATAIASFAAPKLSELQTLKDVTNSIKWDGFNFNTKASQLDDDRSLADSAGAQSRSYDDFGGDVPFFTPLPTDTTGEFRVTQNLMKTQGTELVLVLRIGPAHSQAIAAGDEVQVYHVTVDAVGEVRGKVSYYKNAPFLPHNDMKSNAIVAPAAPVAVTTTTAFGTPAAVNVGKAAGLKATYQGHNVTIGATWTSSNPAVALVTPHGIILGVTAGTANITANYPGATASTAVAVTVS